MSLFVTTSKYSISICISIILHFSLIPIAFADPCALLFLSSTTHRGNLVGPDGADSLCTGMYNTSGFLAKYKSLLDASQFSARHFAWVTDSSGSPRPLRIAPLVSAASPLCVINPLGAVLHSNLSQLLTPEGGELVAAHNVDQLGTVVAVDPVANNGAKVWTGSRGTQVSDCGQWTSSAPTQFGFAGDFTSAVQWASDNTAVGCENFLRIYCLAVPVPRNKPTTDAATRASPFASTSTASTTTTTVVPVPSSTNESVAVPSTLAGNWPSSTGRGGVNTVIAIGTGIGSAVFLIVTVVLLIVWYRRQFYSSEPPKDRAQSALAAVNESAPSAVVGSVYGTTVKQPGTEYTQLDDGESGLEPLSLNPPYVNLEG